MKTLHCELDRLEILRRLRTIHPESQRRWGRMSTHQMLCHVADALRMMLGEKPVDPMTNAARRTVVKWGALYLPLRWPSGIPTCPELDQNQAGSSPSSFAADLAEIEVLLERAMQPTAGFEQVKHPLFGTMTRSAWMRWAYLHLDHHLRQFGA
jgi:hypothetical protein